MFPVGEFNFVVAGLATFAATVGYACSRRLSNSASATDPQSIRQSLTGDAAGTENEKTVIPRSLMQTEVMAPPTRKRKAPEGGFDEQEREPLGYPHNLANIYPHKRSRTPSTDAESTRATTPVISPAPLIPAPALPDQDIVIPAVCDETMATTAATPATEPPRTPSPVAEEASPEALAPAPATPLLVAEVSTPPPPPSEEQHIVRSSPAPRPATPAGPVFGQASPAPKTPFGSTTPLPVTPRFAAPKPFAFSSPNGSGGFAAFAGSTSPFATFNNKPQVKLGKAANRSIWNTGDIISHQNGDEQEDVLSDAFKPLKEDHAIVEAKATSLHPTEKYNHVTGEEDECVEAEQKGVKLYTKRGDKPFVDGVVGHIKILSHKETKEQRILFRREPLWKVSMNVRIKPSVRCTYVPEENVIRLVLKETVTLDDGSTNPNEEKSEVVIYALKVLLEARFQGVRRDSSSKFTFQIDIDTHWLGFVNFKGERSIALVA
ncbi:hypothetical protein CPC08DRAFT_721548 [Agrocybe pediades]|nr:hypothetical protein CPC08DRAFT_721548 [Agrocybe pediades]